MRINQFTVENIKRIKIAKINPKKNVVILEGKNGVGKTSILDSICYLLGGEKLIPDQPVRKGETRAEIKATIDDLEVRRFWKRGRSFLEIKTKDGMTPGRPQTFLNSLIGDLSFDPLKFCNQDRRDRVETLRQISGLDFTQIDQDLEAATEGRKFAKKQLQELEAQGADYQDAEDPGEAPDLDGLTIQYNNILERNQEAEVRAQERANLSMEITNAEQKIKELQHNIETAKQRIEMIRPEHLEKQDPAPILEKMRAAQGLAERRSRYRRKMEIKQKADEARERIDNYQGVIDDARQAKEDKIKAADMPIDGLAFGADDVEFDGVEFSEISQAQKIKISISIAMAQNPKLKIIRILDGSLLDENSMQEIERLAEKYDFQIFIESVHPTKIGQTYYIEEGTARPATRENNQ